MEVIMETIDFKEVMDIIHKEFQSLKVYMEERFATKQELAEKMGGLKVELVEKIGNVKSDTIKWMFLFWTVQMGAVISLFMSLLKK